MPGTIVAVLGPGGVGKSTLIQDAFRILGYPPLPPDSPQPVTCTTRARREGEQDGVHYHFLTEEEFEAGVAAGDFLEHDEVVKRLPDGTVAQRYRVGLRRRDLEAVLRRHGVAVLAITVPGANALKALFPAVRTVLVTVSKPETVLRRMQERGASREEAEARLAFDRHFFANPPDSHLVLVNDDGARAACAHALAALIATCRPVAARR